MSACSRPPPSSASDDRVKGWRRRCLAPLAAGLALLIGAPSVARADDYQVGVENFLYRSTTSLLNRGNALGLDPSENLFRVTGLAAKTFGAFALKASAFGERQTGKTDRTSFTLRQAFAEYKTGDGFLLRVGRQKTNWGSGFVWNPTARLEPPKSPANPTTEQPGIDAARMDISPSGWASLTLVAGRARSGLTDLPGSLARQADPHWTGAIRARLLVRDTDLALTYLAGADRGGLVGADLGRTWGPVALHAETAIYRGSEIDAQAARDSFVRVVAGALWSPGDSTFSLEYFFNGEGMDDQRFDAYLDGLDRNFGLANAPGTPTEARAIALARFSADAALPFSSNLGLRRHYASAAWSHRDLVEDLGARLRAVSGLSDRGLILTPGLTYALGRNLQMSLDLVLLFGPRAAEYKLAPIKRAAQARLRYVF